MRIKLRMLSVMRRKATSNSMSEIESPETQSNRKLLDNLAAAHVDSSFYDVPGFLKGKNSLSQLELDLLGDVRGKSVLHLQCHFGLDTLSLARM